MLAAVAVVHALAIAGLTLMPGVRERLVPQSLMFVEVREVARERPPEPPPLPRPVLREPMKVDVPAPAVALAPEIAVVPPPEPRAAITGTVATPPATPSPQAVAGVEPPRFDMAYLRNPPPAYPTVSRRLKERGRVILNVLVSPAGEAENVEVRTSSGFERLDRAAMEAVRRWRFMPAHRGTDAVAAWALVPIVFELDA